MLAAFHRSDRSPRMLALHLSERALDADARDRDRTDFVGLAAIEELRWHLSPHQARGLLGRERAVERRRTADCDRLFVQRRVEHLDDEREPSARADAPSF